MEIIFQFLSDCVRGELPTIINYTQSSFMYKTIILTLWPLHEVRLLLLTNITLVQIFSFVKKMSYLTEMYRPTSRFFK